MTLPTPPKLYTCANCGARCDYYLQWVDMDHAPGQRWCDDCLATVKSRAPAVPTPPSKPGPVAVPSPAAPSLAPELSKSPQPSKKDRVQ